jgi:hypothetical protein
MAVTKTAVIACPPKAEEAIPKLCSFQGTVLDNKGVFCKFSGRFDKISYVEKAKVS